MPISEAQMDEMCKATIVLGDSKITVEGPAAFVQSQIEKFAGTQHVATGISDNASGSRGFSQPCTEKRLVEEKKPHGHHEIVAVLAFALTESGIKEFTKEDMRRAYIRAGVRPPKHVSQALRDAKNKFEYVAAGAKRGTFRLSNHGDSLIRFDLPRSAD
jgi:hypothetical protein